MKLLVALYLATLGLASLAQTNGVMTSPNLMDPASGQVSVTGAVQLPSDFGGGGLSGGYQPGYNATTNTVIFGYTSGTVAYRYAFSQALQNSGISILGYNYGWQYYNQDYSRGTASATVTVDAPNGTLLHSKSWNLPQTTQGWTNMSGTETFVKGLPTSNIAGINLNFTGNDDRWWAGYWGPQVRNASLSLNYVFDQCAVNPASDPSCPGYAQAYHDQQCSINPLSAVDCPGYYQAWLTQQCSANPMYSVSCPGYAQAYAVKQTTENSSTTTATTTTVVSTATATPDTTSPTSPTSVVGPVSVINPPPAAPTVQSAISSVSVEPPRSAEQQQQRAAEQKRTDGQVARAARGNVAAAARDAAERAQGAKSLEDQAATQGLVVGLMGFVPGFSVYQNAVVPDVLGAAVARQYTKPTVDNRAAQRALSGASDSLHQRMVEQQYK